MAYHDWAAVVVVSGDEGHAVGELGGELVGHDVICLAQAQRKAPGSVSTSIFTNEQSFQHNSTNDCTVPGGTVLLKTLLLLGMNQIGSAINSARQAQ